MILRKSKYRKLLFVTAIAMAVFFIFWIPFLVVSLVTKTSIQALPDQQEPYGAALIFGANLTKDGQLTDILLQRVDAGLLLYQKGVVKKLVVSNTEEAALAMRDYLVVHGVSEDDIEVDPEAVNTPDTCRYEFRRGFPSNGRRVLFLSQGYHLPRLIWQCWNVGVNGIGVPVENILPKVSTDLSFLEIWSIRTGRVFREAALDWLVIFGIY